MGAVYISPGSTPSWIPSRNKYFQSKQTPFFWLQICWSKIRLPWGLSVVFFSLFTGKLVGSWSKRAANTLIVCSCATAMVSVRTHSPPPFGVAACLSSVTCHLVDSCHQDSSFGWLPHPRYLRISRHSLWGRYE